MIVQQLTKHIPSIVLAVLGLPFILFLVEIWRNGFQQPWPVSLLIFNFVFADSLYGQLVSYGQAPFMLTITLLFHTPAAQGITKTWVIAWPNNWATWVFVSICAAVIASAYLSRFEITNDDCNDNLNGCFRALLAADINMTEHADAVYSSFREYCSVLIASSIALLSVVFGDVARQ
jgi:hypothetical protein